MTSKTALACMLLSILISSASCYKESTANVAKKSIAAVEPGSLDGTGVKPGTGKGITYCVAYDGPSLMLDAVPAPSVNFLGKEIVAAMNCSSDFEVQFEPHLPNMDLTLNGRVIVIGYDLRCNPEASFPLVHVQEAALQSISSDKKAAIAAYNVKVRNINGEIRDNLINAIDESSCKLKTGELKTLLEGKLSLASDAEPDQKGRPIMKIKSSVFLDALSCLGDIKLEPSSHSDLKIQYKTLISELGSSVCQAE